MSEGQVGGGVSSITDLRALRTRILGKARVSKPVTNAEALIETLKGADFAEQVKLAVPGGVEFDVGRFVQSVLRALEEDERLLACDPKSVLGAGLRCAEIGLMVGGVMQHAFMVPRARRDGRGGFMYEAELTIGYRGMIALAMRSGKVKSVTSRVVTDREIEEGRFDLYYEGDKDVMIHRPVLYGEKGEPVMVYCLVRFVDGTFHVEPMAKDEIEKIKEQAVLRWNGADGESPWVTNEMEMWRKSPVRRAFKYLNVQVEGLDRAVRLEEERERGQRQDLARLIDATAEAEESPDGTGGEQGKQAQSGEDEPQAARHVVGDAVREDAEVAAARSDQATGTASPRDPEQSGAEGNVVATAGAEAGGQVEPRQGEQVEGFKEASEAISAIAKRASVERPAKYVDPKTGVTWNGWGKAPHWIPREKSERDAFLIGAVKTVGGGETAGDTKAEGEAGEDRGPGAMNDGASAGDVEVTVMRDGQVQGPESADEATTAERVAVGDAQGGGQESVASQGDLLEAGSEETVERAPEAAPEVGQGDEVGASAAS